ncbi:PspA/IM30 family protein [Alkalihalobacterium chitinilyticum]|uniref:PspA/IM30 family protein n=1 Tax=Alkalihalobacterium chitinilyticum TaxID=2980103 RepID=A0ABT5VJ71_9BACI|nr:PspA/IM30 family protein [Alkalihalobacterium chitinilyticum]MDE5415508.1 PspA/IM30 family protein [Alkalihalobacterium chitinilyticum]
MSIFGRLVTLIKGNAHAAIDSMENVENVLNQKIRDLEGAYTEARDGVAGAMAEQKRLEGLANQAEKEAEKWLNRVNNALDSGDEAAAEEMAVQYEKHLGEKENFHALAEEQADTVSVLRDQLESLQESIAEVKSQKASIVAKHKMADANESINKVFEKVNKNSSLNTLNRYEERANERLNKSKAVKQLNSTTSVEDQFKKYDKPNGSSALERIKQQLENNTQQ